MGIHTYYRYKAIDEFDIARHRALWHNIFSKLLSRENHLLSFATVEPFLRQKKYLGIQEIPVEKIAGSVDRARDFDQNFRPLKKNLSARWVQAYVLAHTSGWPPIRVYKIAPIYFVEDGHHRVSVARHLNNHYLDAEVWEYSVNPAFDAQTRVCSSPDSLHASNKTHLINLVVDHEAIER
jgi:hypothetical protein